MDTDEEFEDQHSEEEELDDKLHEKLVKSVLNLSYKDYVKAPTRTEPSQTISEYDLANAPKKVHLDDLTKVLKKKGKHLQVSNQIDKLKLNTKPVPRPLEKVKADRIHRSVGYEKTKETLKRWDPIVTSLRAATHVSYPLHTAKKKKEKEDILEELPKTDLQLKLEALEPKQQEVEIMHLDIEDDNAAEANGGEFPMTMKELMEKRKEAARTRAQESYKISKARRQNKIKSKKYHRVERRQKMKAQMKEFELMQKTNPEAALEKLQEIEKARAEERMSLRHKSTGQWAKNKLIRAKYDKETRKVLADQLALSRDLTQKLKAGVESDSENEKIEDLSVSSAKKKDFDNPWINDSNIQVAKEVEDFVSGYRKYWEEKNNINDDENGNKVGNGVENINENIQESQNVNTNAENADNSIQNAKKVGKNEKNVTKINKNEKNATKIDKNVQNVKEINVNIVEKHLKTNKDTKNVTKLDKNDQKNQVKNKNISKDKKQKLIEDSECSIFSKKPKLGKENSQTCIGASGEWSVSTNAATENDDFLEKEFQKLDSNLRRKLNEKLNKLYNQSDVKKMKNKKKTAKKPSSDDLTLKRTITRPIIDEELQESAHKNINNDLKDNLLQNLKQLNTFESKQTKDATSFTTAKETTATDINPKKFLNVRTTELKTAIPDLMSFDENEEDHEDQRGLISEAFQDDDIVDNFQQDKRKEIESDKPKDIDLTLPGWGSWGGKNIKVPQRKRKRFITKFPKTMARKDRNKGNLILSESGNAKIKAHLVSEVPFPFKNVKDYEASIRAPISNTFVPETAFRRQILPAIETKMGTIIEPMTEEVLLKKKSGQ